MKAGGSLSDKDIKDIIAALRNLKNNSIRAQELMPGMLNSLTFYYIVDAPPAVTLDCDWTTKRCSLLALDSSKL